MDFHAPAEMYTGRQALVSCAGARAYRRFDSLAAAVRHAVELQANALHCTTIETAQGRLQHKQIQKAYDSAEFRAVLAAEQ